jgi:hypothetical protein
LSIKQSCRAEAALGIRDVAGGNQRRGPTLYVRKAVRENVADTMSLQTLKYPAQVLMNAFSGVTNEPLILTEAFVSKTVVLERAKLLQYGNSFVCEHIFCRMRNDDIADLKSFFSCAFFI